MKDDHSRDWASIGSCVNVFGYCAGTLRYRSLGASRSDPPDSPADTGSDSKIPLIRVVTGVLVTSSKLGQKSLMRIACVNLVS